jgi:hypothetical protein
MTQVYASTLLDMYTIHTWILDIKDLKNKIVPTPLTATLLLWYLLFEIRALLLHLNLRLLVREQLMNTYHIKVENPQK